MTKQQDFISWHFKTEFYTGISTSYEPASLLEMMAINSTSVGSSVENSGALRLKELPGSLKPTSQQRLQHPLITRGTNSISGQLQTESCSVNLTEIPVLAIAGLQLLLQWNMMITAPVRCAPKTLTSTSFIIGTGLKKWRPPNRSCRVVAFAICVICKDEVLLANIVCLEIRNI